MDNIQIQCKKIGLLQYEMQVQIAPKEVQKAFDQEYRRFQRKISLPGFRKGKAPVDSIRKTHFSRVQSGVVQNLIEKGYLSGLRENNLNPASSPRFDFQPIKEDEPFCFKVQFEIHPEVQVKHYENLQIQAQKHLPSDKEVQQVIENLRNSSAQIKPIEQERPCQKGDVVFIDLSGQVEGGTALPLQKNIPVELGRGAVLKEIETAILSMKTNDKKKISARFPKGHPDFSDKKADFNIQLNKISVKILPEVSDQWAQSLKAKNTADLKDIILKQLEDQAEKSYQNELKQKALEQLIEKNPIELPESIIQAQKKHIKADIIQNLKQQRASEEQIQKYLKDHDQNILKRSKWNAQAGYLIQALSKQLNLEDVQKYQSNKENEELEKSMRWQKKQSKVLDFIVQKAQITQ